MKGDAVRLAALSAQIQTVGAAIGTLDAASRQLDIAAQAVDLVPSGYLAKDSFAAIGAFFSGETRDVQAQLRDEIALARAEIAKYRAAYNGYTSEDMDEEISTAHSMGIASTLQYVNKVLNNCIAEIGDGPTVSAIDFVNAVDIAVQAAASAAGRAAQSIAQGAANTAAGLLSAFWVPLVVVGAGVALVVAYQKGLLSKVTP